MHDKRAKYVSNHDGDSAVVILDQDFWDTKTINVRLANVWAPELSEDGGQAVQKFVENWFKVHSYRKKWPFIVTTHVTNTGHEKMTLGRYVADITTNDGKHHLNSEVMEYITNHGYAGGIGSIVRKGSA